MLSKEFSSSRPFKILIVDDETNIRYSLADCLQSELVDVLEASSGHEAIEAVRTHDPDVVLLDVRLPDQSGLDVFEKIAAVDPRMPVIIMTAFAKTDTAIEAMRRGAFEYLLKPVDRQTLRQTVDRALEAAELARIPAVIATADEDDARESIVGQSTPMQEVYKLIGRFAPQDATVLITGESGTGKELVARAIYHYSNRAKNSFLAVNCAALPESLLESELFGHERGAFTGADQRRIGKFEQVHRGTIFLDEIGDMTPATQSKALRLLQDQQFERVGGNQTIQTDVRIIAATNRDLARMVEQGSYRRDLYYRLNGFTIALPPLRTRRSDLPLLIRHFLRRFAVQAATSMPVVAPESMELLERHDWPGNIRELQSVVQYAAVQAAGGAITPDCLPDSLRQLSSLSIAEPGSDRLSQGQIDLAAMTSLLMEDGHGDVYARLIGACDRIILQTALEKTGGNQARAASLLGLSRNTLRSKLKGDRGGEAVDEKND